MNGTSVQGKAPSSRGKSKENRDTISSCGQGGRLADNRRLALYYCFEPVTVRCKSKEWEKDDVSRTYSGRTAYLHQHPCPMSPSQSIAGRTASVHPSIISELALAGPHTVRKGYINNLAKTMPLCCIITEYFKVAGI